MSDAYGEGADRDKETKGVNLGDLGKVIEATIFTGSLASSRHQVKLSRVCFQEASSLCSLLWLPRIGLFSVFLSQGEVITKVNSHVPLVI